MNFKLVSDSSSKVYTLSGSFNAAQQAANAKYIEQLRLEAGLTADEDIPFD